MIKLLLVEDDANLRYIVQSGLEELIGGYEIVTACNGKEGLKAWEEQKPDVDLYEQIARGAAVSARVAHTALGDALLAVDAGGDVDRDLFRDLDIALATAVFAGVLHDLTRAAALLTVGLLLDNAERGALLAGDLKQVCENIHNVFDPLVTAEHMELNYIKSLFYNYGAIGYQMTGSGSAVFAIVPDFEFAAVICGMLKDNYPQVFIAKPV